MFLWQASKAIVFVILIDQMWVAYDLQLEVFFFRLTTLNNHCSKRCFSIFFCLRPSLLPGGSNHRPAKPAAVLSKWCWWDPGERNFGSWDSSAPKTNNYRWQPSKRTTPPLASSKSFSQFLPCSHAIPWSFTTFVNAVSVSASASTHRFHRTVPVTLPDLMIYICVYNTYVQSISNLKCSWTRCYQSGIVATHQCLMSPILLLELSTLGGKGFPCWQKNNRPNAFDDDFR